MVWIETTYEFASLFSYRIPDFSSQYAMSSILPGPSTIKLAIVSTAIETTRDIEFGKKIFDIVKDVDIKISLPKKVAQTNVLIKRLKKKKEKSGLETTFGVRGYIHYPEKFSVYLNIPEKWSNDFEKILKNIRSFGTSDSLVWCKGVLKKNPPKDAISAVVNIGQNNNKNVLIIPVKDISSKIIFDDVNIYNKSKKDIFLKKIYPIPISNQFQGKNWIVYEFK